MGVMPFPTRSRQHTCGSQKRVTIARSRPCTYAWAALLLACVISCGPPTWPGGIRVHLGASPRGVRVVKLPKDSPAAKAGLRENDFILAIDGQAIAALPGNKVHALLAGEVGTRVLLRVSRDGSEQELSVPRAPYDHCSDPDCAPPQRSTR